MSDIGTRQLPLRFWLVTAIFAGLLIALASAPARSETQSISMGNFFYGSGTINATVGDQLRFTVSTGNNHTVNITELGIASGNLDKGATYTTPVLTTPGTYRIWCVNHQNQGHEATLIVSAAPTTTTTTTTTPPTTTTTTIAGTTTTTTIAGGTTTTVPGGTTTTVPGATTTTAPGPTTTAPPGAPPTDPGSNGTTLAPDDDGATTTTATVGGSAGIDNGSSTPPAGESGSETSGDPSSALGASSPRISDAEWLRPLWWAVLVASMAGLAWVGIAWRRRPTEYD